MRSPISKSNVMIEELQGEEKLIVLLKRQKFIKAKVIQTGSDVSCVQPGDIVLAFNEGKVIEQQGKKARLLNEYALVFKI